MQRSLATAFRASMAAADDNKFLAHANPAMIKVRAHQRAVYFPSKVS